MKKVIVLILSFFIYTSLLSSCNSLLSGFIGGSDNTRGDITSSNTTNPPETDTCVHSFGDWITLKEPSCSENGEKTRTCALCNQTEISTVQKTELHSYDDDEDTECNLCGYIRKLACKHKETTVIDAVEPTCTQDGLTEGEKCSFCGEIMLEQQTIRATGHTEVIDDAVPATCTTDGKTEGSHCSVCQDVIIPQDVIKSEGHKKVYEVAKEPTCTESGISAGSYCSVCNAVFSAGEEIPPIDHEPIYQNGIEATCTSIGMTDLVSCKMCFTIISYQSVIEEIDHSIEDGVCTVCGYEDINFTDPKIYGSDYGYNYLGTLDNGKNLQELYNRIDLSALTFHNDTSVDLTETQLESYVLPKIYYNDLKITLNELRLVMSTLEADRPVYYWFTGGFIFADGKYCQPIVAPEYIEGSFRASVNEMIYEGVKRYYRELDGESSEYLIAMAYHDMIISDVDYAYKSDGKTPEDSIWAHSVVGVFEKKGVVCEGYTKAFQMLLNASGVENVFVRGHAGERHAWNLVKLDDGKWYWFDLTWNDQKIALRGIRYNYFAVNDTQIVNWYDAHLGWQKPDFGSESFLDNHTPFDDTVENEFSYELPSRSDENFSSNTIYLFKETFKINGNTYAIVGYDKVQLISSSNGEALLIPPAVAYGGRVYEVVYIGAMDKDGYFVQGSVFTSTLLTEAVLPGSIEAVGMGAFMEANSLKKVVIQDGVKTIEALAFWGCRNLTEVYIPSSVTSFELQAFAYCYRLTDIYFDGTIEQWNEIEKNQNWNQNCPTITVHCSDGNI